MVHRPATARLISRLSRGAAIAALLAVGIAVPSAASPPPTHQQQAAPVPATAEKTWYAGKCRNRAGITVVVDFQKLGRKGQHPGRTVVRCAKGPSQGRSGLWALQRARLEPRGTARQGLAFVCRLQGRPGPREKLAIPGNPSYQEKCVNTPPSSAFWGYWRAKAGGSWKYSRQGASTTTVIPGGFEGWSFSLRSGGRNPRPGVRPRRPAGRSQSSAASSLGVPAPRSADTASRGAGWLIRELRRGSLPGPVGGTDWGLTLDALFALHAAGVGEQSALAISRALERDADTFVGPGLYDDPEARIAGSVAKMLTAQVVTGGDATDFAGYDLRAETLALIQGPGGDQPGRVSDQETGFDSSNIFGQSLAVIGLARTGGVPDRAVDFLLDQQCRPGWFRVFGDDRSPCAAGSSRPDADATAVAVQALMTARDSGTGGLDQPIRRALVWLERVQRPDGSFGGGSSTPGVNTNTTGLAGQALRAGGRIGAAREAQQWIVSMQLSPEQVVGTAAAGEQGAIAYDAAGRRKGLSQGITPAARDQWRRASSQALLGLGGPSFVDLGDASLQPGPGQPGPPPAPPPSPDPAPEPEPDAHTDREPRTPSPPEPAAPPAPEPAPPPAGPPAEQPEVAMSADPTAVRALQDYLLGQLVAGDHVEVIQRETTYVDHEATVALARMLRLSGSSDPAVADVTTRALSPAAVDAYGFGVGTDRPHTFYADAVADLVLLAAMDGRDPDQVGGRALAELLAGSLDRAGWAASRGRLAETRRSVGTQAQTLLALVAADRPAAARRAAQALQGAQCDDGSFPVTASAAGCADGDVRSTGLAVEALAATRAVTVSAAASSAGTRPEAVQHAVDVLLAVRSQDALWRGADGVDLAASAAADQALLSVGLGEPESAASMARLQQRDGGFAETPRGPSSVQASLLAVPTMARSSLLTLPGSPVTSSLRLPAEAESDQTVGVADTSPGTTPRPVQEPMTVPWWLLALVGVALLALGMLVGRVRRLPPSSGEVRR